MSDSLNEQQFREHVSKRTTYRLEPGPGYREVTAYHPSGKLVGFINWEDHAKFGEPERGNEIHRVQVLAQHRGRGLATAMYGMARDIAPDLTHSHALTPDGQAWTQKLREKGIDQ